MKRPTLVAATLVVATLALTAACSGGAGSSSTTSGAASTVTDLKIGDFLDVTSWDPAEADIGFDGPYLSAVYDPLVALDTKGQATPALATSWEFSSDDLTLTLHLRTGVTFSDGEAFDADAAVKNLEHLKAGTRSVEAYTKVASFAKVDDSTVAIHLTARDDTILYLMGLGRSYMAAPKSLDAGTLAKQPVGSGPYTLDSTSVAGSQYNFSKVANYWDAATYPWQTVSILPITDSTARQNAMLSGQINVNYGAATDLDAAKQQGWNVAEGLSGWVGLVYHDRTGGLLAPLGNLKVRQALDYAFDGAGILKSVGAGAGEYTNQVFPVGDGVNDPSLDSTYAYDVAKAKQLMSDAGYPDGFSLHMPMAPAFQAWQAITEQSLAAIGVTVTWDDMTYPDYAAKFASYPVAISMLAMDSLPVATVERQLTSPQWFDPTPEYAQFPDVAAAVAKVRSATGDAQTSAIRDLNKVLLDQAWFNVWYQAKNIYFSTSGIKVQPVVGMMFPTLRYISQG